MLKGLDLKSNGLSFGCCLILMKFDIGKLDDGVQYNTEHE